MVKMLHISRWYIVWNDYQEKLYKLPNKAKKCQTKT